MKPADMERFGFNPMKNMFPEMHCRVCDARNPFAFLAPKPRSGKPGDSWVCVYAPIARTTVWVG